MARTANTDVASNGTNPIKRLTCDISEIFDSTLDLYCKSNDIARSSIIRNAVAEFIGYADRQIGVDDAGAPIMELALMKRSEVHQEAGKKRKASNETKTKKANELDTLKAALASGSVSIDDLKAMLGL